MKSIVMDPRTAFMLNQLAKVPKDNLVFPCRKDSDKFCTACTTVAWVRVRNIIMEVMQLGGGVADALTKTIEFLQTPGSTDDMQISYEEFVLLLPFQDEVLGPGALEMLEILSRLSKDLKAYDEKWGTIMHERAKMIEARNSNGGGNVPS